MSELLTLKQNQAVKMQAIAVPGFAVNDTNPDDWLLCFEGYHKRMMFIAIRKSILLELFEMMKKELE